MKGSQIRTGVAEHRRPPEDGHAIADRLAAARPVHKAHAEVEQRLRVALGTGHGTTRSVLYYVEELCAVAALARVIATRRMPHCRQYLQVGDEAARA